MISKELFRKLILEILNEFNRKFEKDKALTKAFGGDSSIMQESFIIDNIINILKEELNDDSDFIDWLFFENLVNNKTFKFTFNDIEYEGSIDNVYDYLVGDLK